MGKTFGFLKTHLRWLDESCDRYIMVQPCFRLQGVPSTGIVPSTMLPGRTIVFTGRGGISVICKRHTGSAGLKCRPFEPCQGGDIITQEQARSRLLSCRVAGAEQQRIYLLPSAPGSVPTRFAIGVLETLI